MRPPILDLLHFCGAGRERARVLRRCACCAGGLKTIERFNGRPKRLIGTVSSIMRDEASPGTPVAPVACNASVTAPLDEEDEDVDDDDDENAASIEARL